MLPHTPTSPAVFMSSVRWAEGMLATSQQQTLRRSLARGQHTPFQSQALTRRSVNAAIAAASVSRTRRVMASAASGDLLVVGPGVLGGYLGKLWVDGRLGSATGLTNTTANHSRLQSLGLTPATKDQLGGERYPYVAFSAPPSGSQDYAAEVKSALDAWDRTGAFVFTSSMSVCSVNDGGLATEGTPTVPMGAGPGTDRLLQAENAVLEAGGNVVRLVGLYHRNRGAHTFFLKAGQVPRAGGYVVNLIHYEDAAGLAFSVLKGDGLEGGASYKGQVFIGSDNHPVTFQDMMEACTSSGVFQGEVTFTGADDPNNRGKRVDNSATRQRLLWQPEYASFKDFLMQGGEDFYSRSGLY